MKIRSGFVSNSSSASFIVTLKIPEKNLLANLQHYLEKITIESFVYKTEDKLKWLNDCCKSNEKSILEYKKEKGKIQTSLKSYKNMLKDYKQKVKEFEKLHKKLKKAKILDFDLLKEALYSLYWVNLKKVSSKRFSFSSTTTMFNGYSDVSEILRQIITFASFENIPIKTKVIRYDY